MTVTLEQVERILAAEEPDYTAAAQLGSDALPHLEKLASKAGTAIAVKAVYLASLIGGDAADRAIDAASQRQDPVLRVTAAAALGRLSAARLADVAQRLVTDPDRSVRLRAIRTVPVKAHPTLALRLQSLADAAHPGPARDSLVGALANLRSQARDRSQR